MESWNWVCLQPVKLANNIKLVYALLMILFAQSDNVQKNDFPNFKIVRWYFWKSSITVWFFLFLSIWCSLLSSYPFFATVVFNCLYDGRTYRPGERWNPDPCTSCECDGGIDRCIAYSCIPPTCPPGETPQRVPGECCQRCRAVSCKCLSFLSATNASVRLTKNQFRLLDGCPSKHKR